MTSDFSVYAHTKDDGTHELTLRVSGMACASCTQKVRQALLDGGAQSASVDLTTGLASVSWQGEVAKAEAFAEKIKAAGYEPAPFDEAPPQGEDQNEAQTLARYAFIAGLATACVMGLGLLGPAYAGYVASLTVATVFIAGEPFWASAFRALRHGQSNMDVPIALALVLPTGMSLVELFQRGQATYFDSVVMLLFILLIGRYLDQKTRGRAREAANALLSLFSGTATLLDGEKPRQISLREIRPEMILSVAAGEKIGADGEVSQGVSEADASMITGETIPVTLEPGTLVFAGMVNLTAPLHIRVTHPSDESLMSEVLRLMQKAEQGHAQFVRLADRVARLYTPAVFGLALLTFCLWHFGAGASWQQALLTATTVLIITCPCAMGLAVPAVQILASARLFKRGILLKSADALERLAKIDTVVFDKTGTLTLGMPKLVNRADVTTDELKLAASLALQSRHPLARAVMAAHGDGPVYALDVTETPSQGLEAMFDGEPLRLGRREWCGPTSFPSDNKMELWLRLGYKPPRRLAFADQLRPDALAVMNALRKRKLSLVLLSGDRESVVEEVAETLGFTQVQALCSPADKCAYLDELKAQGHHTLMVGDGLNDAAALASASVSLSPSSALDLTQNAADLVFQGHKLSPVLAVLSIAHRAERLVWENIALSVIYNVLAVPLAMAGQATPMIAAAAMSLSSLTVVLNAQRMRRG